MMTLQTLQNVASGLKSTLAAMRRALDALNAKIEQFESDKSRSQAYIAENVKAAREAIKAKMHADLASMRDAAAGAKAQREFWASRPLLLSRIPFSTDASADATIRLRYAGELAAMDLPLLALTQKNALTDGNLALVWACAVASRGAGQGKLSDLTAVEIPGQAAALDLIDGCESSLAEAQLIEAAMSGQSMDPVRKLQVARRMQSNRPDAHNSPGRPAGGS
jgi:hypothetical protein